MRTCFLFIYLFLISEFTFGQKFVKSYDPVRNCTVLKYFDRDNQIVLQKSISKDSASLVSYEIGLYVLPLNIPFDDFMKTGALIVFDDDTRLVFLDQVEQGYISNGRYQISTRHTLSNEEISKFKVKKIKYFLIHDYVEKLSKWESQNILDAFAIIEAEK